MNIHGYTGSDWDISVQNRAQGATFRCDGPDMLEAMVKALNEAESRGWIIFARHAETPPRLPAVPEYRVRPPAIAPDPLTNPSG